MKIPTAYFVQALSILILWTARVALGKPHEFNHAYDPGCDAYFCYNNSPYYSLNPRLFLTETKYGETSVHFDNMVRRIAFITYYILDMR